MSDLSRIKSFFKVGDKVRCTDDTGYRNRISIGDEYEITEVSSASRLPKFKDVQMVKLKGLEKSIYRVYGGRFTPVAKENKVEPIKQTLLTKEDARKLKQGTPLMVVDSDFCTLKVGTVVKFHSVSGDGRYIYLQNEGKNGLTGGYSPNRFKLIPTLTKQKKPMQTNYHNKRDHTGRFTKAQFNPAPSGLYQPPVTTLPLPVTAQPLKLRNGSLYRVTGGAVGRLKGVVKDIAVLTVHGKPLAVSVLRVGLASKEDVDAYLADSKENK